jgi:hypothetical protein
VKRARKRTRNPKDNLLLHLLLDLLQLLHRSTRTTQKRSIRERVGQLPHRRNVLSRSGSDDGREDGRGELGEGIGGDEEGVEVEELEEEEEGGVRVGLLETEGSVVEEEEKEGARESTLEALTAASTAELCFFS